MTKASRAEKRQEQEDHWAEIRREHQADEAAEIQRLSELSSTELHLMAVKTMYEADQVRGGIDPMWMYKKVGALAQLATFALLREQHAGS